jgi:hypothetical protein
VLRPAARSASLLAVSLAQQIRERPPFVHGEREYFGLAWAVLDWLEDHLDAGMTTLETGAGASTVLFAAAGCSHTAISPDPAEHERIRAYCETHGVDVSGVTFIAESSATALTGTWEPEPLDLVLVDGAHAFPYPMIDWFYVHEHLKVGGLMLVDDAQLPSVNMLVRYLRESPSWRQEAVVGYRTPLFRRLDDKPVPVAPDWTSGRFDRRPKFDYLPPARRLVTWTRNRLIDRGPLLGLVRRRAARRGLKFED